MAKNENCLNERSNQLCHPDVAKINKLSLKIIDKVLVPFYAVKRNLPRRRKESEYWSVFNHVLNEEVCRPISTMSFSIRKNWLEQTKNRVTPLANISIKPIQPMQFFCNIQSEILYERRRG